MARKWGIAEGWVYIPRIVLENEWKCCLNLKAVIKAHESGVRSVGVQTERLSQSGEFKNLSGRIASVVTVRCGQIAPVSFSLCRSRSTVRSSSEMLKCLQPLGHWSLRAQWSDWRCFKNSFYLVSCQIDLLDRCKTGFLLLDDVQLLWILSFFYEKPVMCFSLRQQNSCNSLSLSLVERSN